MSAIDPVDKTWTVIEYEGNPLEMGSNAFTKVFKTSQPSEININVKSGVNNRHVRCDRKYRVEPGQYSIEIDTDDGARVYAKNSSGAYTILRAFKGGSEGNPWVPQTRTTWIWKLDTKELGYTQTADIGIRIEGFNQTLMWVLILNYMRLVSSYVPAQPKTVTKTISRAIARPTPMREPPLDSTIRLSKTGSQRVYRLATMHQIEADRFIVFNTSDKVTTAIGIDVLPGITATPKSFTLEPMKSQEVVLEFDSAVFNTLQEGIQNARLVIRASAINVMEAPIEYETVTINVTEEDPPVSAIPLTVTSVIVSPNETTLPIGSTQGLTATPLGADGEPILGRTIRWTSALSYLVDVNSAGTVHANSESVNGVIISAECDGVVGTAKVIVPAAQKPYFMGGGYNWSTNTGIVTTSTASSTKPKKSTTTRELK